MDAEKWQRLREGYRMVFADSDDASLSDKPPSSELASVLAAGDPPSDFLEPPASTLADLMGAAPVEDGLVGRKIGAYTVRGVLGRGGMGVVYEAEQENPRRTVALKLIRADAASGAALRRFEQEAQLLGRLLHPGIAQIYEAGHADFGSGLQPYFAMELVRGEPITEYFRRVENSTNRKVEIGERLELFLKVCEAVEHAHQRGVIHRDLKPSNILVAHGGLRTEDSGLSVEESGRSAHSVLSTQHSALPKILDFGVARTIDSDVQMTTLHTEVGQIIGTIPYMSPEQIGGRPEEIDTRSDVYSLGVVLYELVSGRLPYDLTGRLLPEAARIIREQDPAPLRATGFTPALVGARERPDARKRAGLNPAARLIDADLATIVGKALEKDPARRYASVSQFASDITHYLRDEPIAARPASTFYQIRKLAARHKAPFAITGIALTLILALTVWMTVLFVRARASEQSARQKTATAERVKDFMLQVFSASDPDQAKGENPSATELLERGVERIENELSGEPLVQAELLNAIGNIYEKRGEYADAVALLEKAMSIRVRELGELDVATARNRADLAGALQGAGRFEDAETHYEAALEALEATVGSEDEVVAATLSAFAENVRDRDLKKAEAMHRRALGIRRKRLGEQHPDVAENLMNLGVVLRNQGLNKEAEACYREALPVLIAAFGEDRIVVAHTYNSLAVALKFQQRFDEAEEAYLHAQRIYRKLWNDRHPQLASSLRSLANLQRELGHFRDAGQNFRESIQMSRELLGNEHLEVAMGVGLLGIMLRDELGDPAASLPFLREDLAICRKVMPRDHPRLSYSCSSLSTTLSRLGQHEEAVALMREAVNISSAARGPESPLNGTEALDLGMTLAWAGQLTEAETLLRQARSELTRTHVAPGDWHVYVTETWLGKCLTGLGQVEEAEQLLLSARERCAASLMVAEQISIRARLLREESRLDILRALVTLYETMNRPDEVERWRAMIPDPEAALARFREDGAKSRPRSPE